MTDPEVPDFIRQHPEMAEVVAEEERLAKQDADLKRRQQAAAVERDRTWAEYVEAREAAIRRGVAPPPEPTFADDGIGESMRRVVLDRKALAEEARAIKRRIRPDIEAQAADALADLLAAALEHVKALDVLTEKARVLYRQVLDVRQAADAPGAGGGPSPGSRLTDRSHPLPTVPDVIAAARGEVDLLAIAPPPGAPPGTPMVDLDRGSPQPVESTGLRPPGPFGEAPPPKQPRRRGAEF